MKALRPREGVDVEYLATVLRALNGLLLQQVDKSSHDTRKLVTPKLSAFRVPVPPVNDQRRIVGELDDLQAKVDRLKGLQQKTAAELNALLPSILDKAFKGEL
jgi:type I restriction enzyme S subunit